MSNTLLQFSFYSSKISIFIKNLKMIKYILIPILAFGFMWSCSDSELITPGDEYFPAGMKDGAYVVDVDGDQWNFSKQTGAQNDASESEVNGSNMNGGLISIMIPQELAVGTYDHIDGAAIQIKLPDGIYVNQDLNGQLPFIVNITQLTTGSKPRITGNFMGTVYNAATGQTKTLTNGSFVKIKVLGTATENTIFKAKFNGQDKDFSTNAKAVGIVTAALISGKNTTDNQTLSITIPGGIAVGTYTEANEVLLKVNLGTSNPADDYTNFNPADGTYLPVKLVISAISGGENGVVIGTFTGTVAKFVNGVPTNEVEITSGQIKVPVINP